MRRKLVSFLAVLLCLTMIVPGNGLVAAAKSDSVKLENNFITGYQVRNGDKSYTAAAMNLKGDDGARYVAYCVDMVHYTENNAVYTMDELENSKSFSDEAAAAIRKIMGVSYPYISLAKIRELSGIAKIPDAKEAVTAAAMAVWDYSNGANCKMTGVSKEVSDRVNALKAWYVSLNFEVPKTEPAVISVTDTGNTESVDIKYGVTGENADGTKITLAAELLPKTPFEDRGVDGDGYHTIRVQNPPENLKIKVTGVQRYNEKVWLLVPGSANKKSQVLAAMEIGQRALEKTVDVEKAHRGSLKILKVDAESREPLAGAEFSIYLGEVMPGSQPLYSGLVTGEDGVILKEGLAPGTYTVAETKAPEGYEVSEASQVVTVTADSVAEVTFEDEKLPPPVGDLKIIKVDAESREPLAGAEFSIYSGEVMPGSQPLYSGLVTGEDGVILKEGLAPGTYTVAETKAPEGYELSEASQVVTVTADSVAEVTFEDEKLPPPVGDLKIIKVDAESREPLAGAEFSIYSGEVMPGSQPLYSGLVTGEDGVILKEGLAPGMYTVAETKAPEGYEVCKEPAVITVEEGKAAQVIFPDKRIPILPPKTSDSEPLLLCFALEILMTLGTAITAGARKNAKAKK